MAKSLFDQIKGAALDPIKQNPLAFGMSLFNAGLGTFTGISDQQRKLDQANDQIDFQNRQRLQAFNDADRARQMRNQFRADTRMKQMEIAQEYLLPGIQRNADLAFESQQAQNNEMDIQMAFQRENILRQITQQRGSLGSSGIGRGRSFERAVQMAAAGGGRQLGQLEENRIGADFRTRAAMRKTQLDAEQARTNVLAPLMMPLYRETAMSQPLMQDKISAPSNSSLMIAGGQFLGNLASFYSKNSS